MNYATICIPTLNRATHLKRCLDSLASNKWARFSPLQISLDYPPSSKFELGYQEVLSLLKSYDFSKFYSITIFHQEKNLGPEKNIQFLIDHSVGCIILTEDDNEFSPNFLEYMNKGLDTFEGNDKVFSINGMADTNWCHESEVNAIPCKLFPGYGVGMWLGKRQRIELSAKQLLLNCRTWTLYNFYTLWKKNPYLYAAYILQIICTNKGIYWVNGELSIADVPMSIYMHLTDIVCIVPVVSKSRTFGNDGSGAHMPSRKDNGLKNLDDNETFEFHLPASLIPDERNYKKGAKYLETILPSVYARIMMQLKAFICMILLFVYNKRRHKVIKVINRFRKAT